MSYSFESKIRYSEVDPDAKLTWIKLLDYFQDASVFQSESLDLGVRFLGERHLCWVLNSWQICLNRMPKLYEDVVITTLPYEIGGFFGKRNFTMDTKDGERLAYANSFWTLIDIQNDRPHKVLHEMDAYGCDEKLDMDYCDRKLKLPEAMASAEPISVTRHLLDTNGHVNNGRYVELALGLLPDGYQVKEVRAEYKMQAHEGDVFYPKTKDEGDQYTVALLNEAGKVYCTVQFLKAQ